MSNENVILYVYGVFDSDNQTTWPNFPGYMSDIEASAFNTVVFSTFHIDDCGDLYGSVPLVTAGVFNPTNQLDPQLPALYQQLAATGRVLYYSIGNWAGTANDLLALEQILANPGGSQYTNLQNNMRVLTQTLGISGIDFDFEPHDANPYSLKQQQVVAQYTAFCTALGLSVTYCPYASEDWWVAAQIAAQSLGGNVAWWNLQCYSGGATNTPASWLSTVVQNASAMGVTNPATFVVPGIDLTGGPAGVKSAIASFVAHDPGLNGAFVWQLGDILNSTTSVSAYATAVVNGLAG